MVFTETTPASELSLQYNYSRYGIMCLMATSGDQCAAGKCTQIRFRTCIAGALENGEMIECFPFGENSTEIETDSCPQCSDQNSFTTEITTTGNLTEFSWGGWSYWSTATCDSNVCRLVTVHKN